MVEKYPVPVENNDLERSTALRSKVEQIWKRARSNAFAHRVAARKFSFYSNILFVLQITFGAVGVLAVLMVYVVSSTKIETLSEFTHFGPEVLILVFTLGSVIASMFGLAFGVLQNFFKLDSKQAIHNYNHHSYLYLAQRAREVSFSSISLDRAEAIREDIERDFQILKARGQEPSNRDFKSGNKTLYNIQNLLPEGELQSFAHRGGNFNKDRTYGLNFVERTYLKWRFGKPVE